MPGYENVMNARGSRVNKNFLIIGFSDNKGTLYKRMASNNKVYGAVLTYPQCVQGAENLLRFQNLERPF